MGKLGMGVVMAVFEYAVFVRIPTGSSMRIPQPWTQQVACEMTVEPIWPFAYSKYNGQKVTNQGIDIVFVLCDLFSRIGDEEVATKSTVETGKHWVPCDFFAPSSVIPLMIIVLLRFPFVDAACHLFHLSLMNVPIVHIDGKIVCAIYDFHKQQYHPPYLPSMQSWAETLRSINNLPFLAPAPI